MTDRSERATSKMNVPSSSPTASSHVPFSLGLLPVQAPTLAKCFTSGKLNLGKWTLRNASISAMARWQTTLALQSCGCYNDDTEMYADKEDRPRKTRAPRGIYRWKGNNNAKVVIIPPEEYLWYKMYITNVLMLEDDPMRQKFRKLFRLPYNKFVQLVKAISVDDHFDRWCGKKVNHKKSSPIELLVLGTLRYLGRGWSLDDLEETKNISGELHCVFFCNTSISGAQCSGTIRTVNESISLPYFRKHLVEHFDILWHTKGIQWPTNRCGRRPITNM